jgi:hypothetical protein
MSDEKPLLYGSCAHRGGSDGRYTTFSTPCAQCDARVHREEAVRLVLDADLARVKRTEDERDAAVAALSELKDAIQAHRDSIREAQRSSNTVESWGARAAVTVAAYDRVTAALALAAQVLGDAK